MTSAAMVVALILYEDAHKSGNILARRIKVPLASWENSEVDRG
jgi:hypothetical protein